MPSLLHRLGLAVLTIIVGLGLTGAGLARLECPMATCEVASAKATPVQACCHLPAPESPKPCCCLKGDYDAPGLAQSATAPQFSFPIFADLPNSSATIGPVAIVRLQNLIWRPDAGPPPKLVPQESFGRAPPVG